MQIVPLQAVPNQSVQVQLGGQNCQLNVYQKAPSGVLGYPESGVGHLYMDVLVNNEPIISGVLCLNLTLIVRSAYLGFVGDFKWLDNQGSADPVYTGLGGRFSLAYLSPTDLAAIIAAGAGVS